MHTLLPLRRSGSAFGVLIGKDKFHIADFPRCALRLPSWPVPPGILNCRPADACFFSLGHDLSPWPGAISKQLMRDIRGPLQLGRRIFLVLASRHLVHGVIRRVV